MAFVPAATSAACSQPDPVALVLSADPAGQSSPAFEPPSSASSVSSSAPSKPLALPASAPVSAPAGPIENDPKLHTLFLAVARSYDDFTRADGTWWTPLDCLAPTDDTSRLSMAAEGAAHGRKVFTLQILDFTKYASETGGRPEPPGFARAGRRLVVPGVEQALVKVSYEPTDDPKQARALGIAPAMHGGKQYYPGKQLDLFMMVRPSDKRIVTDAGWLYGTVSPDGKRVTSAGLVKSCVGCHQKAPFGRQFGVK